MKITKEIFQVGGSELTSLEDGAVYLINFSGHAALVDAGCGRDQHRLFRNIQACGTELGSIEYLLITHCHYDHTGGAVGVRERTGCRVIAHEEDARFLEEGNDTVTAAKWYGSTFPPLKIDEKLKGDRQEIELGGKTIEAVHIPGHSPGSVAYLTESEGLRVLFGQDVHGPLDASLRSDRGAYLRSLRHLLSLKADILCEGHYGVFRGKGQVERFIQSFL